MCAVQDQDDGVSETVWCQAAGLRVRYGSRYWPVVRRVARLTIHTQMGALRRKFLPWKSMERNGETSGFQAPWGFKVHGGRTDCSDSWGW